MAETPLQRLRRHGQSVWLDELDREMVRNGTLERLVREDGVSGITSGPATFHEAIAAGKAYDSQIHEAADRGLAPEAIFEELAVRDVQDACDVLRPVHRHTDGDDGFVSLEVSPRLARETDATIDEAARLWDRVGRPNLLVGIPGTVEGLPAIRACLERGINVNATLLFSPERYERVIGEWMAALRTRHERGEALQVRSVASFFLGRIDTEVDPRLDSIAGAAGGERADAARRLRGRAALASAKLARGIWNRRLAGSGPGWAELRDAGAAPQKLLWASTFTDDPAYSDTRYVEALIGAHTVTAMPGGALDAFRDHGETAPTLERDLAAQPAVLRQLDELGVDMRRVGDELEERGIDGSVASHRRLLQILQEKSRARLVGLR